MPPIATVGDSGTFYLAGLGRDGGMWGGGDFHQQEYLIIARFLSRYARERSCLGSIGTGARCCIKPHLVSGGGLTISHCGVETHRTRKWDPPAPEEEFFIPGGGDRIFINPFIFKAELLLDIVAILECTKSTESGMKDFSQINCPRSKKRTWTHMFPMSFYWVHQASKDLQINPC